MSHSSQVYHYTITMRSTLEREEILTQFTSHHSQPTWPIFNICHCYEYLMDFYARYRGQYKFGHIYFSTC